MKLCPRVTPLTRCGLSHFIDRNFSGCLKVANCYICVTGSNLEFSFPVGFHTKVKESSLLYTLLIAGRRIIRRILSPRVLALWEMQAASARIRTRVAVIITEVNHCTNNFSSYFHWGSLKILAWVTSFVKISYKQS